MAPSDRRGPNYELSFLVTDNEPDRLKAVDGFSKPVPEPLPFWKNVTATATAGAHAPSQSALVPASNASASSAASVAATGISTTTAVASTTSNAIAANNRPKPTIRNSSKTTRAAEATEMASTPASRRSTRLTNQVAASSSSAPIHSASDAGLELDNAAVDDIDLEIAVGSDSSDGDDPDYVPEPKFTSKYFGGESVVHPKLSETVDEGTTNHFEKDSPTEMDVTRKRKSEAASTEMSTTDGPSKARKVALSDAVKNTPKPSKIKDDEVHVNIKSNTPFSTAIKVTIKDAASQSEGVTVRIHEEMMSCSIDETISAIVDLAQESDKKFIIKVEAEVALDAPFEIIVVNMSTHGGMGIHINVPAKLSNAKWCKAFDVLGESALEDVSPIAKAVASKKRNKITDAGSSSTSTPPKKQRMDADSFSTVSSFTPINRQFTDASDTTIAPQSVGSFSSINSNDSTTAPRTHNEVKQKALKTPKRTIRAGSWSNHNENRGPLQRFDDEERRALAAFMQLELTQQELAGELNKWRAEHGHVTPRTESSVISKTRQVKKLMAQGSL